MYLVAVYLVAFTTFLAVTRLVSSESKYSSSSETTIILESSSSSLEGETDVEVEEEAVDCNHIGGLLNQTSNRVIYTGRTDSRVILIRRANSGRNSTQLRSPDSPWIADSRSLKV